MKSIRMSELIEPLNYPFFLRGLYAVCMIGILCAVVGTYVVLRGMAFYGDALAHSIMPGLAIGYTISGTNKTALFWWGLAAAILSAMGISHIKQKTKLTEDTAIGIVFAGMFALGIAIISMSSNFTVDLTHILFGDVLGVSWIDLVRTQIFFVVILFVVFRYFREFLVISFDKTLAQTLRINVKALDTLLFIVIAITIIVALQAVGIALMAAMLITPVATASLFFHRVPKIMFFGSILACFSGVFGLTLSFYVNMASGAAIVLTATTIFFLSWSIKSLWKKF